MALYSKSLYPKLGFLIVIASALLVCYSFLLHRFSVSDDPAHISPEWELGSDPIKVSSDISLYRARLSHIRPSDSLPPLSHNLPLNAFRNSRTLGVASRIFVLSLSHREDRRKSMDSLSQALDLEFEYVDGIDASNANVDHVMNIVKMERQSFRQKLLERNIADASYKFDFPEEGSSDTDKASNATVNLPEGSSLSIPNVTTLNNEVEKQSDALPLLCATAEDPFPSPLITSEISLLPIWRVLSRGMIACWMGHLRIIRRVARLESSAVAVILEDDVDMEFNITARLMDLWPALPQNSWDIVMLGHCHSNETIHPPLAGAPSLHPSFGPKCTHAYAISRDGARRLARILSTPGFAYSRALDQAISWLIKEKNIRSYSVVPAIVAQSKRTESDIWRPYAGIGQPSQNTDVQVKSDSLSSSAKGSGWRDILTDSTLERIDMVARGTLAI